MNTANRRNNANIHLHNKKMAERTMPARLKPEMASVIAPPVFAAPAALPVPVDPVAFVVPLEVVVREPELDEAVEELGAEERLAYKSADWYVVQLDDAGILAVYGIEAIAPRDSGGCV
jgi:hypothetical protein